MVLHELPTAASPELVIGVDFGMTQTGQYGRPPALFLSSHHIWAD